MWIHHSTKEAPALADVIFAVVPLCISGPHAFTKLQYRSIIFHYKLIHHHRPPERCLLPSLNFSIVHSYIFIYPQGICVFLNIREAWNR